MTLKHDQILRQLEILVWTAEDRLGENPFCYQQSYSKLLDR